MEELITPKIPESDTGIHLPEGYKKYAIPSSLTTEDKLGIVLESLNSIVNKEIELEKKQKVRLIIGDTLARMSAGANENSGQDMGLIIKRVEKIKNECLCHFMLIHHTGKMLLQVREAGAD